MKRSFFQAAIMFIRLYGCTTWTLTKRMAKKLDGNYTRMLRAILKKTRRKHSARQQLYDHLPPNTKSVQVRRTRNAGYCWRSKDELISDELWNLQMNEQRLDDQVEPIYISSVPIQDVAWNTCRERWTIDTDGERAREIRISSMTQWWWWWTLHLLQFCGRIT